MENAAAKKLKLALLINGLRVVQAPRGHFKERLEHLYRHDGGTIGTTATPQELRVTTPSGEDCVVNIRTRPRSEWVLESNRIRNVRTHEVFDATAVARPAYYDLAVDDGKNAGEIVQHMGDDLLGVVPNNHCSYFDSDVQCHFCEIDSGFEKSRSRPSRRKTMRLMVEALAVACTEPSARNLVITSGNFRDNDYGARLVAELVGTVKSVSDDARRLYTFTSIMPPEDLSILRHLKDQGVDGVGFNLEFWRPEAFAAFAPGKARYGRARLFAALDAATTVFGAGHVFSNLVYGIQSLGQETRDETAVCADATAGLLDRGVLPIFTIYHTVGTSKTGEQSLRLGDADQFFGEYASLVHDSRLVPDNRTGVLFDYRSISNHVYNDYYHHRARRGQHV